MDTTELEDLYVKSVARFIRLHPGKWSRFVKELVSRSYGEGWSPEGAGERVINALAAGCSQADTETEP